MRLEYVGILVRPDSPEAERQGRELAAWLEERGIRAGDLGRVEPGMDLLVVLGGDGTLLHAAEAASRAGLPVLGVNMGHLGFLSEIAADELYKTLDMVMAGEFRVEERLMLSAALLRAGEEAPSETARALNEVVIAKDEARAMLRLGCWADHEYITTYRADGLIIATPTGSTAYNLSAGGPLAHAEKGGLILTPICPFMLAARPVLLGSQARIIAGLLAGDAEAQVIVDGEPRWRLAAGDYLLVRRAERPLFLVSSPWKSYFHILRAKLSWGGEPVDLPLPERARRLLTHRDD